MPGAVDVMGIELATNSVTVNSQAPYRKGEYYRRELSVVNTSVPVWQSVAVSAPNETTISGNVFVPKTQELFTPDLDGNLLSDGRWTYTWDAENRLVSLVARTAVGPQQSMKFEYDVKGRRIGKKVWSNLTFNGTPALEQKFLYDGWNLIGVLNSSFALQASFYWGNDLGGSVQGAGGVGGLLEINDVANGIHFAGYDGNGNVSALVKGADGTVSARFEYGPFGEVIRSTGPMAKANPFRFSTKYQDDETDSLYYGFRYYSASMGRWMSRDPFLELGTLQFRDLDHPDDFLPDLAETAFTRNDPLNAFDYLGGSSLLCGCGGHDGPEWVGPAVTVGSNAHYHRALCSLANAGAVVTLETFSTCRAKEWIIGACYNCAKWECRKLYTYMCSKTRDRNGHLHPSWRKTNVLILNDCDIRVPPGEY